MLRPNRLGHADRDDIFAVAFAFYDLIGCLPGTELAFEEEVRCETGIVFSWTLGHAVAKFQQVNQGQSNVHHDALELPDGQMVFAQGLQEGVSIPDWPFGTMKDLANIYLNTLVPVSDEAGGQRMGREALRRTLWTFDGRAEKTALSAAILDRFGGDPAKIVRFASRATPALYAELAPLVLQYASARDPLAVTLVRETAVLDGMSRHHRMPELPTG